jgi:hypothetical protein
MGGFDSEWFLRKQNCLGFVLALYAGIFLLLALACYKHPRMCVFLLACFLLSTVSSVYFLSDRCIIRNAKN